MQISKNYELGEEITDVSMLIELANKRECVAYKCGLFPKWFIKPAAFMIGMTLRTLLKYKFYTIKKIKK